MLSRFTIAQRVWALSLVSILIILLKLAFGIVDLRQQLIDEHKHNLSNVVDIAHSVVDSFYQLELNGELTAV